MCSAEVASVPIAHCSEPFFTKCINEKMNPPQRNIARDFLSHSALPFGVSLGKTGSFTRKAIAATGPIGLQSGIPARPMEQLPRFHGGTVTTQMRNLYRWGWWGKHCFSQIMFTKRHRCYPFFLSLGIINLMGNEARFRHTGFAVFSVPGHLRCYIDAIFLCNSVLRTFHTQIFQTNQHNQ